MEPLQSHIVFVVVAEKLHSLRVALPSGSQLVSKLLLQLVGNLCIVHLIDRFIHGPFSLWQDAQINVAERVDAASRL